MRFAVRFGIKSVFLILAVHTKISCMRIFVDMIMKMRLSLNNLETMQPLRNVW